MNMPTIFDRLQKDHGMMVEAEVLKKIMDQLIEDNILARKSFSGARSSVGSSSMKHSSSPIVMYYPALSEQKLSRELELRCAALIELHQYLLEQVATDDGSERLLTEHLDRLHRYNQIKDSAQILLGVLANIRGVCCRDLYPKFALKIDD